MTVQVDLAWLLEVAQRAGVDDPGIDVGRTRWLERSNLRVAVVVAHA